MPLRAPARPASGTAVDSIARRDVNVGSGRLNALIARAARPAGIRDSRDDSSGTG